MKFDFRCKCLHYINIFTNVLLLLLLSINLLIIIVKNKNKYAIHNCIPINI